MQPAVENFPLDNELDAAAFMNKVVEKEILMAPDQYMWLHRRFRISLNSLMMRIKWFVQRTFQKMCLVKEWFL